MGNYSVANIFQKEPAAIAGALKTVLWVLVLLGLVALDEKALAGIAIALEIVLGLFVRQSSTPTASPTLATSVSVATPAGTPSDAPPPDAVVALRSDLLPSAAATTYAPPS